MLAGSYTIDETAEVLASMPQEGVEMVTLTNREGRAVSSERIARLLQSLPRVDSVRTLVISRGSRASDLLFVSALPRLKSIEIRGEFIQTLDGIETLPTCETLYVDSGENTSRSLERLVASSVSNVYLRWGGPKDIADVSVAPHLRDLALTSCPDVDFDVHTHLRLKSLRLESGKISRLANVGSTDASFLMLIGCPKLQAIEGEGRSVRNLVLDTCNVLTPDKMEGFANLESLSWVGIRSPFPLERLARFRTLKNVTLEGRSLEVHNIDFKSEMPLLERLEVPLRTKKELAHLSSINGGVLVTNGRFSCRNGTPV